jgi:hypothetical protein
MAEISAKNNDSASNQIDGVYSSSQTTGELIHEAQTSAPPARFTCSICRKTLKTEHGLVEHTLAKHGTPNKRHRKRKQTHVSSTTTHVSNMNGGHVITSLVMERSDSLSFSSTRKPSESQKKQKLSAILELLKQKAKCPPVKFVVDVDNIGTIENILDFFKGRSVHVIFYVKNQTQLQIPPAFDKFQIPHEIALIESCDDDDMAALTEALNLDCFIITCDKYDSYLKSGLVDVDWLDSHRIPCIWKKRFDALDKTSNRITLSLPLDLIPQVVDITE